MAPDFDSGFGSGARDEAVGMAPQVHTQRGSQRSAI